MPTTPTPTASIVWMPRGTHTINAACNGEPFTATVDVTPDVVPTLNAQLQDKLAQNVQPVIYYDHRPGPNAFEPRAFEWDDARGIVLRGEWTASGKAAVTGHDYAYFSPAFCLDDAGKICGLTDDIELGSLVNDPAFTQIPRLTAAKTTPEGGQNAAKKAQLVQAHLWDVVKTDDLEDKKDKGNTLPILTPPMPTPDTQDKDKDEVIDTTPTDATPQPDAPSPSAADDSAAEDKTDDVAAADAAAEDTAANPPSEDEQDAQKTIDALRHQVAELLRKLEAYQQQDNERAAAAVEAAVKAGKLAPKDKAQQDFWRAAYVANPSEAQKALDSMPNRMTAAATAPSPAKQGSSYDRLVAAFKAQH